MTLAPEDRNRILDAAHAYFKDRVVAAHMRNTDRLKLSDFNVNPFLLRYIAGCLDDDLTPDAVARALVLPRVLGTSVNTTFGTAIQGFCRDVLADVFPSIVPGMDIEYVDALDGRKKYCQVKSGPNTINADDVDTVRGKFESARRLARTNGLSIQPADLTVGVLYGTRSDLSGHYVKIDRDIAPVHVGREFWHRLTGDENFYDDLIYYVGDLADEERLVDHVDQAIDRIATEIKENAPELGLEFE